MSTLFFIIAVIASFVAVTSLVRNSKLKRELWKQDDKIKELRIENFQLVQTFQRNIDKFEDHWGDAR